MLRHMRSHIKVIMTVIIVLFVASCFAGYGLYSRSGSNSGGGIQNYPVAEIDGKKIMRSEIENGVMRLSEGYGNNQAISSADIPAIRKAVLDGMAIQAELEKEIKTRNIDVTKDDIEAEYTKLMDSYPTREEFKAYLERSGIKENDIKSDIKKQLLQQKMLASLETEISVTDTEARAFYDTAKKYLYSTPAGYSVNIATFKSISSAKLAQSAIENGAGWDKVMSEHKADIETSTPYDKPVVVTDQMMQSTVSLKKIKDAPLNKVTQVVPITDTDAYIAIKRGNAEAKVLSFNEVSGDVVAAIKGQKAQQKQSEFYKTLLDRADIKLLDIKIFPAPASADVKSEDKQAN